MATGGGGGGQHPRQFVSLSGGRGGYELNQGGPPCYAALARILLLQGGWGGMPPLINVGSL